MTRARLLAVLGTVLGTAVVATCLAVFGVPRFSSMPRTAFAVAVVVGVSLAAVVALVRRPRR